MIPLPAHPALGVFLGRDDVREVFFYGIGVAVVVVLLFVITHVLRLYFVRRASRIELPFGMEPRHLDKLRQDGQLTEEEMKAVRKAMSRRFLERTQEQEAAKQGPAKADVLLHLAEQEILSNRAQMEPDQEDEAPAEEKAPRPGPIPPRERDVPPRTPAPPPLPPHLQPLLHRSDLELEEMQQAGFLSPEDYALLRRARGEQAADDEV